MGPQEEGGGARRVSGFYSREAMRQAREKLAAAAAPPASLDAVPPDAPYENRSAIIHAWNGQKFVPYEDWLTETIFAHAKRERESRQ